MIREGGWATSCPPPRFAHRMHLFLRSDPILHRCAPVQSLSPYACAWRPDPPCFPSGESVRRESQLACQLFSADPVSQKVQRLKCRLGVGVCHELLRFLPALLLGQGQ